MKYLGSGFVTMAFSAIAFAQEQTPLFSASAGWIYLSAEQKNGTHAAFDGWYIIPEYHINRKWAAIAEVTGSYGSPAGASASLYSFTAGPVYSFGT